tara:strand:+ start:2881 stop:4407 length:1527 start_codon:yes stop_codon:yes gene_type:complete
MLQKSVLFLFLFFSLYINSQTLQEILNISLDKPNGTARFESMGGAFGALGGDLSAINVNPASSSVFNDNEYILTLGTAKKSNKSLFFNNSKKANNNKFSVNQAGGVWLLKNFGGGNINKISFGINAQTNNSFNNSFEIVGRNKSNSIDKFFLNNSLGFNSSDLSVGNNESIAGVYKYLGENFGYSAQQAFLAYQAYLINYDKDSNSFYSLANYSEGVDQQYISETKGVNTKYNINFAVQFKENYYFGLNINTHEIYINNYIKHQESNFASNSAITGIIFENNLVTQGEGLSIQLGGIAKFNSFRLGVSYQSPTWYNLWDETYQYLETQSIDKDGVKYQDKIDPRVINSYPEYKLTTPSSITTSAAIIFGKLGLLSLDIINRDYSKIKAKPNRDFLNTNKKIENQLTNTIDIRLGTEIKIERLSLRAGYGKMGSPYAGSIGVNNPSKIIDDSKLYSFGIGYDFGETLISFSYKMLESNRYHQLFDSGLTDFAKIDSNNSASTLSVVFKF